MFYLNHWSQCLRNFLTLKVVLLLALTSLKRERDLQALSLASISISIFKLIMNFLWSGQSIIAP